MKILLTKINEIKVVDKPWGHEKWIAAGAPDFKYALKEIVLLAGNKSSLQFHKSKEETNYIQSGSGLLHLSDLWIDAERFENKSYTSEEIANFVSSVKAVEIGPGDVFHVKSGYIHRVEALTDLKMIESSTVELDDVYRISDDTSRPSGKIESEHN